MRGTSRGRGGVVLGLVLAMVAACGNGSESVSAPAPERSTVTASEGSVPPATAPATSAPTATTGGSVTTTTVTGDAAPDFALDLGSGGTFVLSEEARPVFMVFWAEW